MKMNIQLQEAEVEGPFIWGNGKITITLENGTVITGLMVQMDAWSDGSEALLHPLTSDEIAVMKSAEEKVVTFQKIYGGGAQIYGKSSAQIKKLLEQYSGKGLSDTEITELIKYTPVDPEPVVASGGWASPSHFHLGGIVDGNDTLRILEQAIPGFRRMRAKHPVAGHSLGPEPVKDIIISLNDGYGWSREQIADWLETLDHDFTIQPLPDTPDDITPQYHTIKLPKMKKGKKAQNSPYLEGGLTAAEALAKVKASKAELVAKMAKVAAAKEVDAALKNLKITNL